MTDRQNSFKNDDGDFDNEFEFNPSDWMVLDDDDGDQVDDSLLEGERSEIDSNSNAKGHGTKGSAHHEEKKAVNTDTDIKQQQDDAAPSVHYTRSKFVRVKECKKEKTDELVSCKLNSPELKQRGKISDSDQDVDHNCAINEIGNIGRENDVKKIKVESEVSSAKSLPSRSSKKAPIRKETGTNVVNEEKGHPEIKKRGVASSQCVAPKKSMNEGKGGIGKDIDNGRSDKKLQVPKDTGTKKPASGSNRNQISSSCQEMPEMENSSIADLFAVKEEGKELISENTCVTHAAKSSTPMLVSRGKSNVTVKRKNDNTLSSSSPAKVVKSNKETALVVKDDSKDHILTKSPKATSSPVPTKDPHKKYNVVVTKSSNISDSGSDSRLKAGTTTTQADSSNRFSPQLAAAPATVSKTKSSTDCKHKIIDPSSLECVNKERNETTTQAKGSTQSRVNVKREKKEAVQSTTDSQASGGSIAEAMGVNISDSKTSDNVVIDEDFHHHDGTSGSVVTKRNVKADPPGSRKPGADLMTKSSKLKLNTTEVVSQSSTQEGNRSKSNEVMNNSMANTSSAAPKKRVIRRFHRTTQTLVPQVSSKLLQCLIKIPSLDCPRKSTVEVGLQTVNKKDSDLNYFSSGAVGVKPYTVSLDVFQEAMSFGDEAVTTGKQTKDGGKYGIRLCRILPADVDKAGHSIKKADGYTLSFSSKDCGILDLFFQEEEDFVGIINHIRKTRVGQRHVCVSVIKPVGKEEKKDKAHAPQLTATVIFDQNFSSSGYLAYSKTPAWNKPKAEVFVSVHNVPKGIPLSFLSLIFPDAISVQLDDPNLKITKETSSRVRLGMTRKVVDQFLCHFVQVVVNKTPLMLTPGLTREEDVPEMKGIILQRKKIEELLGADIQYPTLACVPRDIAVNRKNRPRTDEEPEIIMQVEDAKSVEKILTGRPNAWKGPATVEKLRLLKNTSPKAQNRQWKSSAPNANSRDLSDISDDSELDVGESSKNSNISGVPKPRHSPDTFNEWRQTQPLSMSKMPPRDSHTSGQHQSIEDPVRVKGVKDERIADRSVHRHRSPISDGGKGQRVWSDRQRRISSGEKIDTSVRDRNYHSSEGGRKRSENVSIPDGDSRRSYEDPNPGKKWPDLNDADFDKRHKVIVPQKNEEKMSRGDSDEGDLRSMLDNLKRSRTGDRRSRSRSPVHRRNVEFNRRTHSPSEPRSSDRRGNRSRSPGQQKQDRRVVRKSQSPARHRQSPDSQRRRRSPDSPRRRRSPDSPRRRRSPDSPRRRRSPDSPRRRRTPDSPRRRRSPDLPVRPHRRREERQEATKRKESPPLRNRKIGVTAKDLVAKDDIVTKVNKETESWKSLWKDVKGTEKKPVVKDTVKGKEIPTVTKSSKKGKATSAESDIAMSKTLFNTLMDRLKQKAQVYEESKDSNLIDAAQVYSQINQLAETLTAIKNEENSTKTSEKPGSSHQDAANELSTSDAHNRKAKDASEELLNYFKPGKTSALSGPTNSQPQLSSDKLSNLHPDLLRYVKAGSAPSVSPPPIPPPMAPPPIPPPVAPPLFTCSSPTAKKAQLEAIAKQLASEILSNNPTSQSQSAVTGGVWMAPPPEEVKNLSSAHAGVGQGPPPPTSQPAMFYPPNSMGHTMRGALFSVPPPPFVSAPMMSVQNPLMSAQSPMMTPQNPMMAQQNPMMAQQNPMMAQQNPMMTPQNPMMAPQNPMMAPQNRMPPIVGMWNAPSQFSQRGGVNGPQF